MCILYINVMFFYLKIVNNKQLLIVLFRESGILSLSIVYCFNLKVYICDIIMKYIKIFIFLLYMYLLYRDISIINLEGYFSLLLFFMKIVL